MLAATGLGSRLAETATRKPLSAAKRPRHSAASAGSSPISTSVDCVRSSSERPSRCATPQSQGASRIGAAHGPATVSGPSARCGAQSLKVGPSASGLSGRPAVTERSAVPSHVMRAAARPALTSSSAVRYGIQHRRPASRDRTAGTARFLRQAPGEAGAAGSLAYLGLDFAQGKAGRFLRRATRRAAAGRWLQRGPRPGTAVRGGIAQSSAW